MKQIQIQLFSEELFDVERLKKLGAEVVEIEADPLVYYQGELLFAWLD